MSNIVSRDMSQIGAFGDEFADEAIRVLVGTPLPGRVWIGKVKRETTQSLGNFTIQREFSTAVGGYAFHLVLWQSSEQSGHGVAGRFSMSQLAAVVSFGWTVTDPVSVTKM